jgi:hypothetical protein
MKQYSIILVLLSFCLSTQFATAQTNCGLRYDYDAAGNRIIRYVPICGIDGGGGHSGKRDLSQTDSSATNQNLTEALFPNPSAGLVNIVFNNTVTDAQLTITDNLGRQVLSTTISGSTIPLDITRLPQGMYYVTINTNGVSFRNTVVRE